MSRINQNVHFFSLLRRASRRIPWLALALIVSGCSHLPWETPPSEPEVQKAPPAQPASALPDSLWIWVAPAERDRLQLHAGEFLIAPVRQNQSVGTYEK